MKRKNAFLIVIVELCLILFSISVIGGPDITAEAAAEPAPDNTWSVTAVFNNGLNVKPKLVAFCNKGQCMVAEVNIANAADLPPSGWEITAYICDFDGCTTDPDADPNLWPIHFRLAVDGWAVVAECQQRFTPLPPLHTKCDLDDDIFTCQSPPDTQDEFKLVRIIESPPPVTKTPTPTPTITPTPTPTATPTPTPECISCTGEYDPATFKIALVGSGKPPGETFRIWREIMGTVKEISSGIIAEDGSFAGVDEDPSPGENIYKAWVAGGYTSEACIFRITIPYANGVVPDVRCPTPGEDSDDLIVSGVVIDQDKDPYTRGTEVLLRFTSADPNDAALEIKVETDENGHFEQYVDDGKAYIGGKVEFILAQTVVEEIPITKELFKPCRTPEEKPTPTPEITKEPRNGDEDSGPSLRGERLKSWQEPVQGRPFVLLAAGGLGLIGVILVTSALLSIRTRGKR